MLHAGLAIALVSPGLFAQTTGARTLDDGARAVSTASHSMSGNLLKSSQLIGMDVQDAAGEDCAEVVDLLVCDDGRVAALLLSIDDVDDALVILPAEALLAHFEREEVDADEPAPNVGEIEKLTLGTTHEKLASAPRVSTDEDAMAAALTEDRVNASYEHFGIERKHAEGGMAHGESGRTGYGDAKDRVSAPSTAHADNSAMPLHRVSKLMDCDVKNSADEDLGEIDDLVVSLKDARVSYAVMTRGGMLGMGEKQFAVPYKAFSPRMKADEPRLQLDVAAKQLDERDGFERLPATADNTLFHERTETDTGRSSG